MQILLAFRNYKTSMRINVLCIFVYILYLTTTNNNCVFIVDSVLDDVSTVSYIRHNILFLWPLSLIWVGREPLTL